MCWKICDFNISEDDREHEKLSCPLDVVKTRENEIGFLTATSSWGYQNRFSAEASQSLGNTTQFYDWVGNNLINLNL